MEIDRKKILHLMVDRDIRTQAELSRRINITPQGLHQVLAGGGFTHTTLGELCKVLDASPNDLLAWEEVTGQGPRRAS